MSHHNPTSMSPTMALAYAFIAELAFVGLVNLVEFASGTEPNDTGKSVLLIARIAVAVGGFWHGITHPERPLP